MTERSVSVVIAAYNPGQLLLPTLESIVNQTLAPAEILVVDDCSTEDLTWVEGLGARLVRTRMNCGPSVARNIGVSVAGGCWIAFCDQDDIWMPTKLALQAPLMSSTAGLIHTDFDLIDADGVKTGDGYGSVSNYRSMLEGDFGVLLSSALVRRELLLELGGFNPFYLVQQDLDLFLRVAARDVLEYVPQQLVGYRLHASQGSRNYWRGAVELKHLLSQHALPLNVEGENPERRHAEAGWRSARRVYAGQALAAARLEKHDGDLLEMCRHLKRMTQLHPGQWVSILRHMSRPNQ